MLTLLEEVGRRLRRPSRERNEASARHDGKGCPNSQRKSLEEGEGKRGRRRTPQERESGPQGDRADGRRPSVNRGHTQTPTRGKVRHEKSMRRERGEQGQCNSPKEALQLTVTAEGERVLLLPRVERFSAGVPLVQSTVLLARRGKTARFAALMNRVADPRDASVAADGLVLRVDEDDLVVLVDTVLVDLQARAKQEERKRKSERGRGGRKKAAGRERRERGGGGRLRRPERYA